MIKQYVNLPNSAADHYGASLNLVVNTDQLEDENSAYSEWWVEATGADNVDLKYLPTHSRARMRYRTRHHSGTSFRNVLLLPHVGGDRYTVKCSKRGDRSNPVELEEIETWRKIFYTVHWMNNACRDTFNAVKDRFKTAYSDAFIELEEVGFMQTLLDEPWTLSSNVLPHLYRRRPRLTHRPWHVRIVIINDICDLLETQHSQQGLNLVQLSWDVGRPFADRTPNEWLVSARARVEPGGSWRNISAFLQKEDDTHFSFDIVTVPEIEAAVNAGGTYEIQVRTLERNHYLGHSIGNFVCARINETGSAAEIEQTILQTFTHEVGHGFQQVIRRERIHNAAGNFISWETNADWHTDDYGGQGPHCHNNAQEVPALRADGSAFTTSGLTYESTGATLCTMFFRDDDDVDIDGKFCQSCLPRLKRVKLSRSKMIEKGWNDY